MTSVSETEIETAVRTMFAEEGPAALEDAFDLYEGGGITSITWVRAMNAGLARHQRDTGQPAGLHLMIMRETL